MEMDRLAHVGILFPTVIRPRPAVAANERAALYHRSGVSVHPTRWARASARQPLGGVSTTTHHHDEWVGKIQRRIPARPPCNGFLDLWDPAHVS